LAVCSADFLQALDLLLEGGVEVRLALFALDALFRFYDHVPPLRLLLQIASDRVSHVNVTSPPKPVE
jgi:hypothetical protein